MSQNGSSQISNEDEETEVLSQDVDVVYTGISCSQLSGDGVLSSGVKQCNKLHTEDCDPNEEDNTEVVSQGDDDVVYTGNTCSQLSGNVITSSGDEQLNKLGERPSAEDDDPDATYLDDSLIQRNVLHSEKNLEKKVSDSESLEAPDAEETELDICSQELTQPIVNTPLVKVDSCSQESTQSIENSPLGDVGSCSQESTQPVEENSSLGKNDTTLELTHTECITNRSSDNRINDKDHCNKPEIKKSDEDVRLHSQDEQSSLSSNSHAASSSSSSKRPTDSDDTDDMVMGSQDMFESQGSSLSSQNNVITVSQFLPTLQFSGDIPSSQSYENFLPGRLHPASPTSSTPLRPLGKVASDELRGEVISISDEEDVQKFNEKRKLSDSGDENKPEVKRAKRHDVDSRQSIMIVGEVNSFKKPLIPEPEDPSASSQGFHLYLSESDPDISGSQSTEMCSPLNRNHSWKSHSGSASKMEIGSDTALSKNDSLQAEHDASIVHLDDDMEDEIQCVSTLPVKSSSTEPEIILDASGTLQALSKSGDIEVLSPPGDKNAAKLDIKSKHASDVKLSPSQKQSDILSSSFNQKIVQAVVTDEVIQVLDNSKENIQPGKQTNIQMFENDFVATFTCTYRVSCKTVIDMQKKEPIANTISLFEVLESKTVPRRDSSPSALEESSPGRGGGSPGSIASGPGPFPLQPSYAARFSMMSTSSSSSSGSSASHFHRQAPAQRSLATGKFLKGANEPPNKQQGPAPWRELLSQSQDELSVSGAVMINKWATSIISNSSSDDNKTSVPEDKGLDTVPEDDGEEVLGIPSAAASRNPFLVNLKRGESCGNASSTPISLDKDSAKEEVVIKTETETPTSKRKRGRPPKAATPSKTPRSSTKKKAPTPRKKEAEMLLTGDQSSIPEDSSLSSGSYYYAPGSQVFALWRGYYYSGKIESAARANHWNVVFHDGVKKVIGKHEILLINTFEIGQLVCAETNKNGYEAGEVIEVTPLEKGDDLFTIKLVKSGKKISVPISQLCLSESQVQQFVNERPTSATSSSSPSKRASSSKNSGGDRDILKNLDLLHDLPGKRVRTPKGSQASINSPGRPGPSNTARRLIPDGSCSSTADDEPLATSLASGALAVIKGVEPEKIGFANADPLVRKGKGAKNSSAKKPLPDIEDEDVVKQLGPIPSEGSKIFAGFSFLLTQTDVMPKDRREPVTDSEAPTTDIDEQQDPNGSVQYPSDSECFKFTFCPMVKDRLARQIIQGGGKVLKDWTEIAPKDISKTYVVSNRPCLTPIFIHCIARGVKGVSHDYVIDCCRQGKRFASDIKNNFLPPGYSHVRKEFVLWREHKSKSCLHGETILVVGKDKLFKAFWDDLLKLTGAATASVKSNKDLASVTLIVAENSCPESYLNLGVPVVSPAWVTQSLITNLNLPIDAHPSFAYDYVEPE